MGAYGIGTQRVEDELAQILPPSVRVIRMDADTTRTKGAHQRLLEEFDAADSAVLVGTQMIAKGLDFPEVTLVGVINADTMLKLPDFRAAERTYDLLEQVAGRAGRGDVPGQVIVQTYWASHPAMRAVASHNRDLFLEAELAEREDATKGSAPKASKAGAAAKKAKPSKDAKPQRPGSARLTRREVAELELETEGERKQRGRGGRRGGGRGGRQQRGNRRADQRGNRTEQRSTSAQRPSGKGGRRRVGDRAGRQRGIY